jgi:hypothetical protein
MTSAKPGFSTSVVMGEASPGWMPWIRSAPAWRAPHRLRRYGGARTDNDKLGMDGLGHTPLDPGKFSVCCAERAVRRTLVGPAGASPGVAIYAFGRAMQDTQPLIYTTWGRFIAARAIMFRAGPSSG